MSAVLTIDFGTTHSLAGIYLNGKIIPSMALDSKNADPTLMRTLMYFPNPDECFFGLEAIEKFLELGMEGRLFRSFKSQLPNKAYLGTVVENRIVTLESMIGLFLLEIKKRSEKILGQKIDRAVLGRPARYSMDPVQDEFALHRMRKACEFAGFKEFKFVPEPLAAALEFRKEIKGEKTILIGDFGGGTSDFTILKIAPREFQKSDVLSVEGCPLAGDVLDGLFMSQRLNRSFGAGVQYQLPMSKNVLTMPPSITDRLNRPSQIVHLKERETYNFIGEVRKCALTEVQKSSIDRLFTLIEDQQIFSFFESIEAAKKNLSLQNSTPFKFNYPDLETEDHFNRSEFEFWASDFRSQIIAALDRSMQNAALSPDQIDFVFLTGGTAYVPFIRGEFEKRFGKAKLDSKSHFHSIIHGLNESARMWNEF